MPLITNLSSAFGFDGFFLPAFPRGRIFRLDAQRKRMRVKKNKIDEKNKNIWFHTREISAFQDLIKLCYCLTWEGESNVTKTRCKAGSWD